MYIRVFVLHYQSLTVSIYGLIQNIFGKLNSPIHLFLATLSRIPHWEELSRDEET